MNFKLAASDYDGTLFRNETISSDDVKGVHAWRKAGHKFGVVSGRDLGFMLTARLGGVVFSRTQALLDYYGVSEASAAARDNGGVPVNGGDLIDANKWYTAIGSGDTVPQYYTYSATNIRP